MKQKTSYKRRMSFLQELKNIDCEKICIFIATPYEQCLIQNQNRDRVIPEEVIKRMYLNFDTPAKFEGFDEIKIEWNFGNHTEPENIIQELYDFDQENPHHTLTLGQHCEETAKKIAKTIGHKDFRLLTAGLLHDIGKVFTQKFENGKGEKTDQAHYLQHHHVSAYEALLRLGYYETNKDIILDIVQLIRWHMYPYNIKHEKTKNKFIRLVGQEFYDRLMILHEADKVAH